MGLRINTNILSVGAQRNLANTSRLLSRAMQRLASGKRVNTARDDAAGMAIGLGLQAQRRGMLQAIRNLNDSRGFLFTAEGALETQTQIVQRMRELAMQSANGALSDESRRYLNNEVQQLLEEFNRISTQTQFNGVNLLDGSLGTKRLQAGAEKSQTIDFSVTSMRARDVFAQTSTSGGDLLTTATGTFQARVTISMGAPTHAITADINGDGNLDIITVDAPANTASIALGNGNGTFKTRTTIAVGTSPIFVATVDVNGDGLLDLVTADNGASTVSIALGNGNGTFQTRTTIASGASPRSVVTSDMNGDGFLDIITSDQTNSTVSVSLGNGNGTFQTRTTLAVTGSNLAYAMAADVNGDGKMDILSADNVSSTVSIFFGNGNGTFQSRTTIASGGSPRFVSAADVNGDGMLDIISSDYANATVSTFLGNGNGTFQTRTTTGTGVQPMYTTVVDVNGDGLLDILEADNADTTVSILIGNGNGTFKTRTTLGIGTAPRSVVASDINGDGVLDIISGETGGPSIFLGNSTSTGSPVTTTTSIANISIATQSEAEDMLDIFDDALEYINTARSNIGALQSRLDFAESVGQSLIENLSSAESQVMDADYSIETADFSRLQILQQAGVAVLGQANINAKLALKLLERI